MFGKEIFKGTSEITKLEKAEGAINSRVGQIDSETLRMMKGFCQNCEDQGVN